MGGLNYVNTDTGTDVFFSVITGEERLFFAVDPSIRNDRTFYSLVIKQNLTKKLQYIIQHDHGWQQQALTVFDAAGNLNHFDRAQWYGINQLLLYEINDKLKAGVRYEWFRDDDGFRILGDGNRTNYHQVTVGLNWKPCDCILVRPECRYDWAQNEGGFEPYDLVNNPAGGAPIGTKGHQWLLGLDVIWTF